VPTRLLTSCADIFAPIIARLANMSFGEGRFPTRYKKAQVMPLLKKSGLDSSSPASYRPISNLNTISKVLERLALIQLRPHLLNSSNFSEYQSGYRTGHSTETALLEVLDGVYTAADDKQVSVVIGLDLSAAFDTVQHDILLGRLRDEFGITSTALSWLTTYVEGREQYVKVGQHASPIEMITSGVPQGSVLGPILFAAYTSPVGDIIKSHGVRYHQYADDTQLHIAMQTANSDVGLSILADCTTDVKHWYLLNGLQLNADKSEVMLVGTHYQLQAVSTIKSVSVADTSLPVTDEIKTLGVVLDSHLNFKSHVSSVIQSCNYHAHAIRHIRDLLEPSIVQTLACSLILSRLDYCNSLLYGAPIEAVSKLQRLQNNVARIVLKTDRRCDARPLLKQLHWLPIDSRIQFKLALLTFKVRSTSTPSYLSSLLASKKQSGYSLRSSCAPLLYVPRVKTEFARRAFRVAAPVVWNCLPFTVQSSPSIAVFKSRLKTFLFNRAFD